MKFEEVIANKINEVFKISLAETLTLYLDGVVKEETIESLYKDILIDNKNAMKGVL